MAPLSERIGMQDMKEALEDLAFAELNPHARESVFARLRYLRQNSGDLVGRITRELHDTLVAAGVEAEVLGREKRSWSIWKKMERDSISFEQLSDIVAFRIVVPSRDDSYKALGIVHGKFQMVPGRFKDYISTPKRNGYRSVHTTVIGPEKHRIEVQIRSRDMHGEAEARGCRPLAIQAGGRQIQRLPLPLDSRTARRARRRRKPEEFLENTKLEMFQDQVFCFSPAGELIALPRGATPVDFAYAVHTEIGDTCVGARINGRIAPLRTRLRNGDQVEIIRSDTQTPSPAWEGFVVTGKARSAIRRFRVKQERTEYAELGRQMVEKSFREAGHDVSADGIEAARKALRHHTVEDLYVAVGAGNVASRDVVAATVPKEAGKVRSGTRPVRRKRGAKGGDHGVPIRGLIPGLAVHLATCCHPIPGDRIVGIVSAGKGVTIHTIDCESLQAYDDSPERWLDVAWDAAAATPEVSVGRIRTTLANAPGSLSTLATVIADNKGNISNLKITDRTPDFFEMHVDIEVKDLRHLTNIVAALRLDPSIASVDRVRG